MIRHFVIWLSLALLGASSSSAHAQPVRILTAQADGLDAVSGEFPPTDAHVRRLSQIADTVRPADADLVVIDGIPNRSHALKLAALLKPATYQLAVFSTFPNTNANRPTPASTTILSKRPPFGARSAEWRATGQIALPGGFAFAGFRSGTNAFCFYAADLPGDGASSLSAAGDPLASRRRELAAQYLAHHIQWLGSTLSNQFTAFCVIGDFVADPKTGRLENAGRALQQSGFGAWLAPSVPEPGSPMPSPYSALLARNVSLHSAPTILAQRTLRQPVCVYEINAGGKPGTIAAGSMAGRTPKAARTPGAMVVSIWLGMILVVCAVTAGIWRALRRGNPGPGIFRQTNSSQLVLDVDEVPPASAPGTDPLRVEAEMWQARARDAEQRVEETHAHVRAGMLQRMQALFRDHLVTWLSAQRGKLLASHDSGVQQVLELEERLQRIQGNFQEQLRGRDQRITELEQEIQAKEKLIRKLLLARVNPSGEAARE
jgi:hypothetical protein